MSEEFPGLVEVYVGPNEAHRTFRTALANAKATAYIFSSADAAALRAFLDDVHEKKRQAGGGPIALSVVSARSTADALHLAVHIRGNEVDLINDDKAGFVSHMLGIVYREVHRVFETYLVELFAEIGARKQEVLYSGPKVPSRALLEAGSLVEVHRLVIEERKTELTHAGFSGLEKAYEGINLPIVPTSGPEPAEAREDVRRRLVVLNAVRNIMEHNRSVVNPKFLSLVPNSA